MNIFDELVSVLYNSFGGVTIITMFILFLYAMYRAHKQSHLDWTDLVTQRNSNNVSLTKFLQLVGGVTGTWMVIYTTLHDKLTYDLLLVYLTYVGAIEGWSKFVSAKYHIPDSPPKKKSPPTSKT